jgi:hypothetical protein
MRPRRVLGVWAALVLAGGAVAAALASETTPATLTATGTTATTDPSPLTTSGFSPLPSNAPTLETAPLPPPTPPPAPESAPAPVGPEAPTPAPAAPTPEPDAGDVAWTDQVEASGIHVIELGTGRVHRIAEPADNNPFPSPDGSRLTYIDGVPGTIEQHPAIIGIDGSGARRFPEGFRLGPWAPDSRHLLTSADDGSLLIVDVDDPVGEPRRVASAPGVLGMAWSPSGADIAWADEDGAHVVSAAGGESRTVHPFRDDDREFWLEGWTPDGRELLFSVRDTHVDAGEGIVARDAHGVVAVDVGTGATRTIAETAGPPTYLAASPDGRRLAYLAPVEPGDATAVTWTVDITGASPPVATGEAAHELRWSPDGQELLALRPVAGSQDREVVAINPGGGYRMLIPARPGQTFFNLRAVPGSGFAVVDAGTQDEWR